MLAISTAILAFVSLVLAAPGKTAERNVAFIRLGSRLLVADYEPGPYSAGRTRHLRCCCYPEDSHSQHSVSSNNLKTTS